MAKGTSTKGTSTTLSNTPAATNRLPPEKPPKKKEPANDHNGHTHYADERCLVSNERCIPEDGLHHFGPNKCHGSDPQIDHAIHYRVF